MRFGPMKKFILHLHKRNVLNVLIATQTKDNDSNTTDSEDISLADLGRKKKQPMKRKLIQSDSESDHDDSADDAN
ncbi:hypothetical protein DPMN_023513 [Dreissena polymorpha]|uniref:Uncharacterized protein n=1 Tax=Dreissena polymorpha TaxID=45954 RepID=A0A9D4LL98_DREPO|nr:hypothetical protein DPMN_023513 [Dreissena polymorpha]